MERERYQPPSDFLMSVVAEEVTFGEHAFGRANLARLIALTRDDDDANRDWATFLLAQTDEDGVEVRQALLERLTDPHRDTRHEALVGVALRDPAAALPFVVEALRGDTIRSVVLEAAAAVADPSLIPVLDEIAESWRGRSTEDSMMIDLAAARRACAGRMQD